jgi:hypothetical protein
MLYELVVNTEVSKEHTASIFRPKNVGSLEDESNVFL